MIKCCYLFRIESLKWHMNEIHVYCKERKICLHRVCLRFRWWMDGQRKIVNIFANPFRAMDFFLFPFNIVWLFYDGALKCNKLWCSILRGSCIWCRHFELWLWLESPRPCNNPIKMKCRMFNQISSFKISRNFWSNCSQSINQTKRKRHVARANVTLLGER